MFDLLKYGGREEGVVYPGDVQISVEFTPGAIACPGVTSADTSCNVNISRGVYNLTLTQANDVGVTVDQLLINSELIGSAM